MKLNAKDRLLRGMAVLETLKYCRGVTGEPALGEKIERCIVDTELKDLLICTRIDETDECLRAIGHDIKHTKPAL